MPGARSTAHREAPEVAVLERDPLTGQALRGRSLSLGDLATSVTHLLLDTLIERDAEAVAFEKLAARRR
jgi:hypothetical protein